MQLPRDGFDDCWPNNVWSGTVQSGSNYYNRYLQNGTFNSNYNTYTYAFGVRCVLDLKHRIDYRQLCDRYEGYGALRCQSRSGGCPGSYNNNCIPNVIWSGTPTGSNYYNGWLNSGVWNTGSNAATYTRSVRCVPDLKTADGCPGSYNNNCIPNVIWSGTPTGSNYYNGWLNSGVWNTGSNAATYTRSVRCVPDLKTADGCPGSGNGNCYPNFIHSGTLVESDSSKSYEGQLNSGTFYSNGTWPNTYTRSVRCVLVLNYRLHTQALRLGFGLRRLAVQP